MEYKHFLSLKSIRALPVARRESTPSYVITFEIDENPTGRKNFLPGLILFLAYYTAFGAKSKKILCSLPAIAPCVSSLSQWNNRILCYPLTSESESSTISARNAVDMRI
jgi:hypothetical protein